MTGLVSGLPRVPGGGPRYGQGPGGWVCLGAAFFARGYEPRQTRFRGGGASLSDLCPASRSRRVITLRALTASRIMDPSPLVPGTLVGLELFIYWEKRPLCRSKQSLVSRSHSVYGPAAERTITGDSFLRCRPLTSRRLAQPLRGHGIPPRVIASSYTGTAGASAVGPQPINTLYDTKERKEKGPDVCRAWDCQRALLLGGWVAFLRGVTSPDKRVSAVAERAFRISARPVDRELDE